MFKKRKKENLDGEMYYQPDDFSSSNDHKMSRKKKITIASISLILVAIISLGIYIFTLFNVKKSYTYVASLTNISEPIQVETSGSFEEVAHGYNLTYTKKANYTITGKVVEKHYYMPYNLINKLCRFDLGIIWGPLLTTDLDGLMTFKNNGKRFLTYKYSSELVGKLGSKEAVINSLSNNHVIHSSEHVLKLLRNIKKGDYIQIEGYLVDLVYEKNGNKGNWSSSVSRTDHGDGACEIIYVTNVTWLKVA